MDIPTLVSNCAALVNVQYLDDMYENLRRGSQRPDGADARNAAKTYLAQFPGFEARSDIGGAGCIGILRNSWGPTVLLRAAMYMGQEWSRDRAGMTRVLFAATGLRGMQTLWKGTLVLLFQPSVNQGAGARGMIEDGLCDPARHACPIPDVILGQRVMALAAGTIGTRDGIFGAGLDSYRVTLYGRGGHASQPHVTTDPMAMAASVMVRLQEITSKRLDLHDSAIVTVDRVMAGNMGDVIADQAVLKLNIRYFDSLARHNTMYLMKMIVKEVQLEGNASKESLVELIRSLPLLVNHPAITHMISASFDATFEEDHARDCVLWGGTEDFGILAAEVPNKLGGKGVPSCFWLLGGADPDVVMKARGNGSTVNVPMNHGPWFPPVTQPTMLTGLKALVAAALTFLTRPD